MRLLLAALLLVVSLVGVGLFATRHAPMPHLQQDCVVSANYLETVEEHKLILFRVLAFSNGQFGAIPTLESAVLVHSQLISMRRYHQSIASHLPTCAIDNNTAIINAITASQDVLSLYSMAQLFPNSTRAIDRLNQGITFLRATWGDLLATQSATTLKAE